MSLVSHHDQLLFNFSLIVLVQKCSVLNRLSVKLSFSKAKINTFRIFFTQIKYSQRYYLEEEINKI